MRRKPLGVQPQHAIRPWSGLRVRLQFRLERVSEGPVIQEELDEPAVCRPEILLDRFVEGSNDGGAGHELVQRCRGYFPLGAKEDGTCCAGRMITPRPGARHEPDLAILRIPAAIVMVDDEDACTIVLALRRLRLDIHADENRGAPHQQNRAFIIVNGADVTARRIDEGHPELKNRLVVPDVDDLASHIARVDEIKAVAIGDMDPAKPILQRRGLGTIVRRHRQWKHAGLGALCLELSN
jgi:hypothetical protein